MTEVSIAGTHADLQLGPTGVVSHSPAPLANGNGVPITDGVVQEDPSSTIKCICGYNDDDGNTVYCEICDTWQHIECYYPTLAVPDVHECCDCRPRSLDIKSARERQTQLRELQLAEGGKRTKRPKSTGHKKKTKDSVQLNGWPVADPENGLEQRSGSPRDQAGPSKRAKTSHKQSASVASLNQVATGANGRRKNGIVGSGQNLVRSPPDLPNGWDYFSPEFMQLHRKQPFQHADGNFMTSISVATDLATWSRDQDELAKVTNGIPPEKVFSRYDDTMEALEEMSPGVTLQSEEDQTYTSPDGAHPVIQRLVVNSAASAGAFLGEMRGHISRRDDYERQSLNRWHSLRHPEPFVFFHPSLPIVIDARDEGTKMRYIRRSCQPNTKMLTILDSAKDYHFCLVLERDLEEGEEVTLNWEIPHDIRTLLQKLTENGIIRNQGFKGDHEQYMCNWASGVLANFGGCACGNASQCVLSRFDRRGNRSMLDNATNALKLPKGRKGKKGTHNSPLSTGRAVNSRASSEAANAKADVYDDRADSRSVSGSSRSKPTSRDNTPGGNAADEGLSAREKRKIEQLERRFENIDHDDTPVRKKKRNSAGSALNTPAVGNSKQFGLGFVDSHNPSSMFGSTSKHGRSPGFDTNNGGDGRHRNSGGQETQARMYVESGTQTDTGAQNVYNTELAPCKKRRISYSQRILARTREEKPKPTKVVPRSPKTLSRPTSRHDNSPTATATMLPPPRPSPTTALSSESVKAEPVSSEAPEPVEDTEMRDAPEGPATSTVADASTSPKQQTIDSPTTPPEPTAPLQPPPAPWPAKEASPEPTTQPNPTTSIISPTEASTASERKPSDASEHSSNGSRPKNLHVTLPPVPNFSSQTPTTPSMTATPGSVTGSSIAQSPLSVAAGLASSAQPLLSPAINSAGIAQSPLKKKISLSDYSRKKKAAAKEAAKEATTPAAAVESTTAPLTAVAEGASDVKAEENKLEDSTAAMAAAAGAAPALPRGDSVAAEDAADIAPVPIKDAPSTTVEHAQQQGEEKLQASAPADEADTASSSQPPTQKDADAPPAAVVASQGD